MTRQVLSARKMLIIAATLLMGLALLVGPKGWTVGTSAQSTLEKIVIMKTTVGGDGTFDFTTDFQVPFNITTSGGTGTRVLNIPGPGTYTVSESPPPPGWQLTNLACSENKIQNSFSNVQTAVIALDPGEFVTCTYTNTKCPAITLTPTAGTLPATQLNTPYSQTFTATGGCASPFTYSSTIFDLPPGLTLGVNGVLSGTTTVPGDFTFTVKATDSCGCSLSQTYTLQVACPIVPLHLFNSGTAEDGSVLADGTTDAHYLLTPPSGGPSTVQASAALRPTWLPNSADSKWIVPPPSTTALGTYIYSTTFKLAGCDTSTVVITGSWASENEGFIRVNGGTAELFPTTPGGFSAFTPFTLNSSNSVFVGGTNTLEFVVNNQANLTGVRVEMSGSVKCCGCLGAISINPLIHQLWGANVGYPALNLTASGGAGPPYIITLTSGSLPPGMFLDSDGTLHGTPVTPGTYSFDLTAEDANGCTGVQQYQIVIVNCPAITINPAGLPAGTMGTAYSQVISATGGCGGLTISPFSVTGGTLPPGLTVAPNGTLSGTPTMGGTFTFTVKATDKYCGCALERTYQLTICGDLGNPYGYRAGKVDDFAAPNDPASPSLALKLTFPSATWTDFDDETLDRWVGHTFTSLPANIVKAELKVRMKPGGSDNDSINLLFGQNSTQVAWGIRMADIPANTSQTWDSQGPQTFTFNLAALPPNSTNLMAALAANRYLDVAIQDDTTVDYIDLLIWTCPANRLIDWPPSPIDTTVYPLARGMNEFCIWGGGGGAFNSPTQIDSPLFGVPVRSNSRVRFGAIGLCYGRILSANDRFAFKYTFNAIPGAVLSYPDVNPDLGFPVPVSETRRNVFGAGLSPIGFQLYFRPQSRVKPFVNTSGGFIFFKDPVPRLNGARFNFTYDFGGGIQVFRDSRRAFTFGYKYQRISNAGRALNDPGFNAHIFYFGYSIFSAPKIAQTGDLEIKRKD